MKRYHAIILAALALFGAGAAAAQTDTLSSVRIGTAATAGGTANGVAIVTELIGTPINQPGSIGNELAGLQYVPGQIPLDGAPASIAFYTLTGLDTPGGVSNPTNSFSSYATLTSPTGVVHYLDVASKLTANSYSALTFAEGDLGFGARAFYTIHHRSGTDYLAQIVPGTGVSSQVRDLKPMSWAGPTAGGPADTGASGYFGLAWATGILSAGAPYADESIYYLRTDASAPGDTYFGVMIPALTGASTDTLNLSTAVGSYGAEGYTTLAFSPSVIGNYGANQFYYLRQDTGPGGTGHTILGRLNPSLVAGVRTISDIANLGGVFTTLTFAADATGPAGAWGSSQFYVTGALADGGQSISFEAIPDHDVGDVFTVVPTASSGLDIDLTVVSGSATIQTTGVSGATPLSQRIFTVTTTGPGVVTLEARQAGRSLPLPAYAANMLQQSFYVRGLPTITSPTSAAATVGAAFTYDITAAGSPFSFTASPLPAGLVLNGTTGVISGTPTEAATTIVSLTATNPTGTSSATTLTITVAAAGTTPVITGASGAAGTAGTPFATYQITATGSPTSYTASPLPAGLVLNTATGVITGTPSAAGTTLTSLTATNATGTSSSSTLTITIAAVAAAPTITSASSAAGTVGTPFTTYTIVASGTPTSYSATGLPAGLAVNATSGTITGTPTTAGVSTVTLSATNATGTGTAPLTITVAAAGTAPLITSPTTAPGTVGTPFEPYVIVGTGLPTSYSATGLPPGLTVNGTTGEITGTPAGAGTWVVTITATNSLGSSTATLTITVAAGPYSRIVNFSARAVSGPGEQTLILGFVVSGDGKNLLIRGIGPSLSNFGVVNTLSDPLLTLLGSSGEVAKNDDWQVTDVGQPDAAQIAATGAEVGAFALSDGSKDSALIFTVNNGVHTTSMVRPNSTTGVALTEIYDIDTTIGARLINVSARMNVTAGEGTLIAGLIIAGDIPKRVLIRGVGPALSLFSVPGVLADPRITVFSDGTEIAANDNWETGDETAAQIAASAVQVGAFALPAGSKDASLLVTLQPGAYTVHVNGVGNTTGVALVEVYDVE